MRPRKHESYNSPPKIGPRMFASPNNGGLNSSPSSVVVNMPANFLMSTEQDEGVHTRSGGGGDIAAPPGLSMILTTMRKKKSSAKQHKTSMRRPFALAARSTALTTTRIASSERKADADAGEEGVEGDEEAELIPTHPP
mmetsp:Transcript_34262/g.70054  ORF Transcript_34262/g.70054 Transcript_34262/m.70054 type:complete len:139 (-) Transcript_34262:55-471(-)